MTSKATLETGKSLVDKMRSDPALAAKINATTSFSEFKAVAKKHGYDLGTISEEEARAIAAGGTAAPVGELTDEDLEAVAGGWGDVSVNMNNW